MSGDRDRNSRFARGIRRRKRVELARKRLDQLQTSLITLAILTVVLVVIRNIEFPGLEEFGYILNLLIFSGFGLLFCVCVFLGVYSLGEEKDEGDCER